MTSPRVLTKSRYKLGCECPTKLFYSGKKEYANQKQDDPFMVALAKGGYQVGELAKYYLPGGIEVKSLDQAQALAETKELLRHPNSVVYEAALSFENLFVRVDILRKTPGRIEIYEVKSKTFDPSAESPFWTKSGKGLATDWRPYMEDVAFQKYVAMQVFPGYQVNAFLMLVNKRAACPSDGLNQKFRVVRDGKRRQGVSVSPSFNPKDLEGDRLVTPIDVDRECDFIYCESPSEGGLNFAQRVQVFSDSCQQDLKFPPVISKACKDCEFIATTEEEAKGLRNGRMECWRTCLPKWTDQDLRGQTVLNVWDYRKKDKRIAENRLRLSDLTEEDFSTEPRPDGRGLSSGKRQWLQVEKAETRDTSHYLDREGLAREMRSWVFPLNFIDFETSTVAIPFHKGHHPYEGIAFQFSHHVVHEDGRVEHRGEYLNTERGEFPNVAFARALRTALEHDQGTIFRYAAHENTYLNKIQALLQADPSIPDRDALLEFLASITSKKGGPTGNRAMVDMFDLVKRYYYAPEMQGSNSIKAVLPATLGRSAFLQAKYAQPIYGARGGIPSFNFQDMIWLRRQNGAILDPYGLLPPVFRDLEFNEEAPLDQELQELRDGGAAMMAYARLQFEDLPDGERQAIRASLLKYCELDTLAMVMIYEAWRDWVANG